LGISGDVDGVVGVGEIFDFHNLLGGFESLLSKLVFEGRNEFFDLNFFVEFGKFDFFVEELNSLFGFGGGCVVVGDVLFEDVFGLIFEVFNRAVEGNLAFGEGEPGSNRFEGLGGQLLRLDGLDQVGDIVGFEFLHGDDELLLLNFPEDGDVFVEFLESSEEGGTIFGEGVPVDEGLLTGQLEDLIEIGLDVFYFGFAHSIIITNKDMPSRFTQPQPVYSFKCFASFFEQGSSCDVVQLADKYQL
jgi:hypothetical protein